MRRCSLLLAGALLLVAGCACHPPQDVATALARVNDNLARVNRPLQYKGWVSFKFRDAEGKSHRYLSDDTSVLFARPRCLRFDIRHSLAGNVAQFGSNDEAYWLWIEPEVRKLWWGRWDTGGGANAGHLAISPRMLLDALMLQPLSPQAAAPTLEKRWFDHWLVYRDDDGRVVREIRLDRCAPYQVREIIDRLPDGEIAMRARLNMYRPLGSDGPQTARRYVVEWPHSHAKMNLDVHRAKFRPDIEPDDIFEFPAGWQGACERLDQPASEQGS
jgi:hypothetical protein